MTKHAYEHSFVRPCDHWYYFIFMQIFRRVSQTRPTCDENWKSRWLCVQHKIGIGDDDELLVILSSSYGTCTLRVCGFREDWMLLLAPRGVGSSVHEIMYELVAMYEFAIHVYS